MDNRRTPAAAGATIMGVTKTTDFDIIAILTLRPSTCKDLAALLGMNERWLSHRLTTLVRSGKVIRGRMVQGDGRTPVYSANGKVKKE